ncbi:MAG: hypothetical protein IPL73_19790 [Candidatus Obscuribacter sp.]|nr:hypothetical protein [Candidatus Obscuribacter sp.]
MTDIRATCKSNVKTQATVGMILSTGHFPCITSHLEDVTERATATETHEKVWAMSPVALTDLGLTTATTATIGRVKWKEEENPQLPKYSNENRIHTGSARMWAGVVQRHFSKRTLQSPWTGSPKPKINH